ncbi:MAG: hypothetical protein RML72_07285, partial [Bacteroidia bacterium]|nr:hypothetical protein [Bacteroidia bacterium]MDW8158663.1 hypothetical protein [Bacteroidia bacterium]
PTLKNNVSRWLKSRIDNRGSFIGYYNQDERDALTILTLYWLQQAGEKEYEKEITQALNKVAAFDIPYQLPLLAMLQSNSKEEIIAKVSQLLKNPAQASEGKSALGATRKQLTLEVTALAILALLPQSSQFEPSLLQSLRWLLEQRDANGFWGTLHTTMWVMKTLYEFCHTLKYKQSNQPTFTLSLKEPKLHYQLATPEPYLIKKIELQATPFLYKAITFEQALSNTSPYSLATAQFILEYTLPTDTLQDIDTTELKLTITPLPSEIKLGSNINLAIQVANKSIKPLPTLQLQWQLPRPLKIHENTLQEMLRKKEILGYWYQEAKLILYFESIGPSEVKRIQLPIRAQATGRCIPQTISLYYTYDPQKKVQLRYPPIIVKDGY